MLEEPAIVADAADNVGDVTVDDDDDVVVALSAATVPPVAVVAVVIATLDIVAGSPSSDVEAVDVVALVGSASDTDADDALSSLEIASRSMCCNTEAGCVGLLGVVIVGSGALSLSSSAFELIDGVSLFVDDGDVLVDVVGLVVIILLQQAIVSDDSVDNNV